MDFTRCVNTFASDVGRSQVGLVEVSPAKRCLLHGYRPGAVGLHLQEVDTVLWNSNVDTEYLYHYFGYLRSHLEQVAPHSAQKNINLKILSSLPVPDIPMSEQRRVAAYLGGLQAKVDSLRRMQVETAAELDALLPSVLDKAFKGEL